MLTGWSLLVRTQSFCRKFVWHRECLWPEELPEPCLLVLAAEDDLVPSKLLRQLLTSINHPCEVNTLPILSPLLLTQPLRPHAHAERPVKTPQSTPAC